jgi:hypothetical protein
VLTNIVFLLITTTGHARSIWQGDVAKRPPTASSANYDPRLDFAAMPFGRCCTRHYKFKTLAKYGFGPGHIW